METCCETQELREVDGQFEYLFKQIDKLETEIVRLYQLLEVQNGKIEEAPIKQLSPETISIAIQAAYERVELAAGKLNSINGRIFGQLGELKLLG